MFDQAFKLRQLAGQTEKIKQKTRIIAIASGKGGVGKSNITLNLGLALKKKGVKVLLIDADMGTANLDILLGLTPVYNLGHILQGKCTLKEALLTGPSDLKILPGTSGVQDFIDIKLEEVGRLLNVAAELEDDYDIILIDIGAGVNRTVINYLGGADEALIVLTPEPTSVMDAYSLIKIMSINKIKKRIGLVVNQVESKQEANELSERMASVIKKYLAGEVDIMGLIPFDINIRRSVSKQKAFLKNYPESKASRAIYQLADRVLKNRETGVARGASGFIYRIIGMFNRK